MNLRHRIACFALTLAVTPASDARPQAFVQGDLYLYTPAFTGASSTDGAIVHVDAATGTLAMIVDLQAGQSYGGSIIYDPHRDALLFTGVLGNPLNPKFFYRSDALGNTTNLGHQNETFYCLASAGDGRIYLRRLGSTPGEIHYLDANDQLQQLMDATGTQPFTLAPGGATQYQSMVYHAPTQALIVAGYSAISNGCSGGNPVGVVVRRVTLSSDGTRVTGPTLCSEFDVSTSSEQPVGLTVMSDGDLLLVVDTNTNDLENRMLRVDPISLAITPFATSGNYVGVGATNAGTFSQALGNRAVVLDTFHNVLRAYNDGEVGAGTIVPTSQPTSASSGTGGVHTLIEIRGAPCTGSFAGYGSGLAGTGGFVPSLTGTGCPVPSQTATLHIASVIGGGNGGLLIGAAPASVGLFGGTLLVTPLISLPAPAAGTPGAGGAGSLSIPLALGPNPAISGMAVYFQAVFFDPGAPFGISFTNGLQLIVGC